MTGPNLIKREQDFAGKVALVTGGGSGIGQAAAQIFAARGAAVAIADINDDGGRQTAESIEAAGGRALFMHTDVTSEDAVVAMIKQTVATFGGLHCAFNNAGYGGKAGAFHEFELKEWDKMIAATLTSVFLCMKHEIAHMIDAGGGAIVNTSSGAGIIASPNMPAYTAAKHGVLGLMKVAAREFAPRNIRINSVLPGAIDTPMMRHLLNDDPVMEEFVASTPPMRRMGRPEEVAEAAVWLCSDAASYVSGESMLVDGASVGR
jgi:NAD(P)-dependent dehydrogenase (short-subunit alcohol dehydrogenase family)